MKAFHHGGRIGDLLYALYTVKELGGGELIITDRQVGNWDLKIAQSLLPFLACQGYISYISFGEYTKYAILEVKLRAQKEFYDLVDAEQDNNPEDFPEWVGPDWPGNIHLAKRYAHHFGVEWVPGSVWLQAPHTKKVDVAFHVPQRRMVRPEQSWVYILRGLRKKGINVVILSGKDDAYEWQTVQTNCRHIAPDTFLDTANYINSAKLFLGAASSCNACAEGLGKTRLVEQAKGCDNIYPTAVINGWSDRQVIEVVAQEVANG